jgi:outer membrane protein TolC
MIENPDQDYIYSANASINLLALGNIEENSGLYAQAQAAYNRAVSNVFYELAQGYINLMWAYERVELVEQIRNKRKENRDMMRLKYNSGTADLGSLRVVEADLAASEIELDRAKRYIEMASFALEAAIGKGTDGGEVYSTIQKLKTETPDIPKPDFVEIVKTIPEFFIAQAQVDIAKSKRLSAIENFFPHINLSAGYNQTHPNKYIADNFISAWQYQITLSYPLFSGGSDFLTFRNASRNLENAKRNLSIQTLSLRSKAMTQYNNLIDARSDLSVRIMYHEALKLQAEISDSKYINGLSDYRDWYLSENEYISAQMQMLESKRALALAWIAWINFLGEYNFTILN